MLALDFQSNSALLAAWLACCLHGRPTGSSGTQGTCGPCSGGPECSVSSVSTHFTPRLSYVDVLSLVCQTLSVLAHSTRQASRRMRSKVGPGGAGFGLWGHPRFLAMP